MEENNQPEDRLQFSICKLIVKGCAKKGEAFLRRGVIERGTFSGHATREGCVLAGRRCFRCILRHLQAQPLRTREEKAFSQTRAIVFAK